MWLNLLMVILVAGALLLLHAKAELPTKQKWYLTIFVGSLVILWLVVGAAPRKCPDVLDPAASQNGLPAETED